MTATEAPAAVCPNCGSSQVNVGASGNAMCIDCLHYWNPADPTADARPVIAPFAMAPAEEVFPVTGGGDPTYTQEIFASLEGGTAILEGGQVATVVTFKGDTHVVVTLANGDTEVVDLNDVERILPPVEIPEPAVIPEAVDELPPDVRLSLDMARLIIRAGAESVNGTGADITPGTPPVGFLPTDPELHSVIERAAGLAVGMLLEMFELDVDAVLEWVGAVQEQVPEGDPATEVDANEHAHPDE